jgi:Domain found in Dishevelled, Egl-10, and Pleckstrin (DEP)
VSRPSHPEAFFGLPPGHACAALRAAMMAMNVIPESLPNAPASRLEALMRLDRRPRSVAFIDLCSGPNLHELDRQLPRTALRARIFLTRLAATAHVSTADRRWVQAQGFGGLWAEFDTDDAHSDLREALDASASVLGVASLSSADLPRHVRVREPRNAPARERIRQICGASAEAVALTLGKCLSVRDRSYHLRNYPACFVGRSAVRGIAKTFGCTGTEALEVGRGLHALGLLVHVTHDHDLIDGDYFYRLTLSSKADAVDLGHALRVLRTGLGHEGSSETWTGAQAIDILCETYSLQRHQAWIIGQRLAQFGAIQHVLRERPFIDGPMAYSFTSKDAKARDPAQAQASPQAPGAPLPAW